MIYHKACIFLPDCEVDLETAGCTPADFRTGVFGNATDIYTRKYCSGYDGSFVDHCIYK